MMITCGYFARSASDRAMKDREEGENFGDMSWDNWRHRKQHLKQDVIVVAPNTTKFMHQGQVVNPTEDPLMIYRGMSLKLSSYIVNLRYIYKNLETLIVLVREASEGDMPRSACGPCRCRSMTGALRWQQGKQCRHLRTHRRPCLQIC